MHNFVIALILCMASLATLGPLQLDAQQGDEGQQREAAGDVTLVYEREVYTYDGQNRRDPFRPLTDEAEMGPRFESLSLQGIIYSTGRGRSVALLSSNGRIHRVRVGDTVGNSRVVEIGPARVVLAVENFGTIRQEILQLPTRGGSDL